VRLRRNLPESRIRRGRIRRRERRMVDHVEHVALQAEHPPCSLKRTSFNRETFQSLIPSTRALATVVGNVRMWYWNWFADTVSNAFVLNADPSVLRLSTLSGPPK